MPKKSKSSSKSVKVSFSLNDLEKVLFTKDDANEMEQRLVNRIESVRRESQGGLEAVENRLSAKMEKGNSELKKDINDPNKHLTDLLKRYIDSHEQTTLSSN
ncbi:MAG: hypothetical protein HY401_05175 [Elusimicrobia bacterium]|nr:hypothetical protein [Elusimicrobiota bacterium]